MLYQSMCSMLTFMFLVLRNLLLKRDVPSGNTMRLRVNDEAENCPSLPQVKALLSYHIITISS